jgi:hypothetical protein
MRKLDVKEIHGFTASLGLKLLKPSFLSSRKNKPPLEKDKREKREPKPVLMRA